MAGLSVGPARAERVAPGRGGTLEVHSATTGAEVFVDGQKVGEAPLPAPLPFAPGEHTIKVIKSGFAPYIDVFKIDRKKPAVVNVELVAVAGVLKLRASVEGARVYVDGKFVGEAPLTTELEVGARAIQVSKGGFKDFFQNVSAVAGQDLALEVQLEELPVGVNPYKLAAPLPPKWFEKWWVWTVGAVGVAVVVTAAVVPTWYATRDPVGDFCKGGCSGGVVGISLMPVPK
jgi:PEGA domain